MKTRITILFLLVALIGFAGNPKESKQCKAKTQAGYQCTRMTTDSTGYCWQHKYIKDHPTKPIPKDSLHIGPKGGVYYHDAQGNKHYVKH